MKLHKFGLAGFVLLLPALGAAVPPALAQEYPTKTVHIILPFGSGATNLVTRWLANKLSPALGQPVVVEPKTGAGGNIAHEAVAKSAPDGYTLLVTGPPVAANPSLYPNVGYDPRRDYVAIARIASIPNVVVVHPSVPARSLKELAALARKYPGKMAYASGGVGSSPHLGAELLKSLTHTNILHVPYKGGTLGLIDMMRGEIDMAVLAASAVTPHIRDKRVRGLAVLDTKRLSSLPQIPTSAEAGLPKLIVVNWYILFAPAGTPAGIVQRLNAETVKAMRAEDTIKRFAEVGIQSTPSSSADATAFLASEYARWGDVIRSAGIRAK